MHRVIVSPLASCVPAAGSVRVTRSLSTSALISLRVVELTLNPALSKAARASSCVKFLTSGTMADCGPAENHTLTVEPFVTLTPPLGSCLVSVPSGSVELASVSAWKRRPSWVSFSWARSLVVCAVNVGTVTVSGSLCRFAYASPPTIAAIITIAPMIDAMMAIRLRLRLAAAARCSARDFNAVPFADPFDAVGTASNCPVTGLKACVASVAATGFIA